MHSKHLSLFVVGALCLAGAAQAQPHKLLISEVVIDCINPEASNDSSEWMEIYNPNSFAVSLDNYYITDVNSYWTFTTAVDNKLPTADSDHLIGFPIGSTIPANGIVVVAALANRFLTDYLDGNLATFTALPGNPQLFQVGEAPPTGVERMRNFHTLATANAQTNFSRTNASATNGEFSVLFYWDGNPSNNVVDIDMVSWGNPTGGNLIAPKTGVNAPGYQVDGGSHTNLSVGTFAAVYRISAAEPGQPSSGGNGVGGTDETMEINGATEAGSSWRGLATTNVPTYTNNDLVNPDGVTPGVSPLQAASVANWTLH
jgi:hypothetical protein